VTLDGAGGDDTLTGTSGDDTFTGGAGADQIIGGSGDDTIVESRASSLVAANFTLTGSAASATLVIGAEGTDTLQGIEHASLTGTQAADILDASAFTGGSVTLATGGGTDTLRGTTFDDRFEVNVSQMTAGTKVTVKPNGGSGDRVAILGTSGVSQSDLNWITWDGLPATQQISDGNILTDLYTGGGAIEIVATTINLNGHTLDTGRTVAGGALGPVAGHITLEGRYITIDGGAKLLAKAAAG
jgi:hypothetical protein